MNNKDKKIMKAVEIIGCLKKLIISIEIIFPIMEKENQKEASKNKNKEKINYFIFILSLLW